MDAKAGARYGVLAEFLAEQLFGRWSLVLHYDLGRGLRVFAGRDEARLKEMVALANRRVGDLSALVEGSGRDLRDARPLRAREHHGRRRRIASSVAVIIDQASYLFPAGEPGRVEPADVLAAGDDAELGDEPAREAAEHGVRADRRAARPTSAIG